MIWGSFQQFVTTIDIKAAVIKLPDQFIPQPEERKKERKKKKKRRRKKKE